MRKISALSSPAHRTDEEKRGILETHIIPSAISMSEIKRASLNYAYLERSDVCMMDREGCGNSNSGNSLENKCAVVRVTRNGSCHRGRGAVGQETGWVRDILTFRHRASCILGQAFRYSPENAFYIFNQQIYFII